MKIALLTTDSRECFRDYAAPRPYYGTAPAALLEGLAELPDVEVHVVSCTQQHLTPEEQLARNIRAHSLFVPKFGWLRTGYQGCIRAVRNRLKQIQPDIVHGQGTERDCAISAVFSGYPNVLTIHGNMRAIARINRASPFSYQWFAARLEQFTLPRADGIVCITDYTRKAVQESTDRTWIVPNAVSQDFFEISRAPQSPPLILCVGSIAPHKNQNALIRSLDEFASKRSFALVFLGQLGDSSEYNTDFQLLVEQRNWCNHKGFADRKELKAYLQRASLLVLPSLEDNCPMVVLEAMASGVPVLAARVGGVPELIEDGQTGLLFDPSDSKSIGEAASRILDSASLAANLAANAEASARQRFHPQVIAHRHVEIYKEVLAGKN